MSRATASIAMVNNQQKKINEQTKPNWIYNFLYKFTFFLM